MPLLQFEQGELGKAEKRPAVQGVHEVRAASGTAPLTQRTHATLPGTAIKPLLQLKHVEAPDTALAYVPPWHMEH